MGISGAAVVSAFCHCENCRHWTGDAEVASAAVWNPECVRFLKGKNSIDFRKKGIDMYGIKRASMCRKPKGSGLFMKSILILTFYEIRPILRYLQVPMPLQ